MGTTLVVVVVIVVLIVALAVMYNALVRARLKTREGWSAVEVQLQRRGNLIPNLVETVKGYVSHERGTLEAVTNARSKLESAGTPGEAGEANNQLTQALRTLFAVAEAYPDLKANQNFLDLQNDLSDTEDKIAYARTYYNATVGDYNGMVQSVPTNIIAGMFGFREAEFFQGEDAAMTVPQVQF